MAKLIDNLEKKSKEHFKTLENNNKILKDEFKSIYHIGGCFPGILYGNPRVHNIVTDNIPKFRLMLSAIGTPVYKLAKFLVSILLPHTVSDYTFKDLFSFVRDVFNFDHNIFMASLDAELLFTKISIDETIKNAVDDLFSNNMYQGRLSKSELYYILKLETL